METMLGDKWADMKSRKPFSEPRTENDMFIFLSGAQQNVFFNFCAHRNLSSISFINQKTPCRRREPLVPIADKKLPHNSFPREQQFIPIFVVRLFSMGDIRWCDHDVPRQMKYN